MTDKGFGLKSHPQLFLHEHISQITAALQVLQNHHSARTITQSVQKSLAVIPALHDTGKATRYFQDYIEDPPQYSGNRQDKEHTPLSTFLTIIIVQAAGWSALDALLLIAVTSGHHSRFPNLPDCKIGSVDDSNFDIDRFSHGSTLALIKKQLATIDFGALELETGLPFVKSGLAQRLLDEPARVIRQAGNFLREELVKPVKKLEMSAAVTFRLRCQLVYSLLLEADKALLAVSTPEIYLRRTIKNWQSVWVERRIGRSEATGLNDLRQIVRCQALAELEANKDMSLFSLTAPTGVGKTLMAASWALKMREIADNKWPPKIIIVLPFLSVIDQTVKEYKKLLAAGKIADDGGWLLTSHSLADRIYNHDLSEGDNSFLVDTWRSDIIITTYDQFLMSLWDPRAKYQMRFHNLCDSLIVMDEVQSLPCKLWRPLNEIFMQLIQLANTKLLLMSATLPSFVGDAKPLLPCPERYFSQCKRYLLHFRLQQPIAIEDFCAELDERLLKWFTDKKRVLLTFNTRHSARKVRDYIADWRKGRNEFADIPLYFISADVTPRDRLQMIEKIKQCLPCIVVSTQCIEAGVDIDMDMVIRDFAPLDSLIQIAGRCNREGRSGTRGIVEVVDLMEDGKRFSKMIYDEIHLSVTRNLLPPEDYIAEENILPLAERYFAELSAKEDTGYDHLVRFAYWQNDITVEELLRGKEINQYTFLVLEEDPGIREAISNVLSIVDHWSRREGWRKLSSRLALVSVSIFAKPGFNPASIATKFAGQWILRDGYYASDRGLIVEGMTRII